MFSKNNVTQSMIDAVQSVLVEDKKLLLEPEKKKEEKEDLKGNQGKLDKNHNGKIDPEDFKLLRMKKEEKDDDSMYTTKAQAKRIADKEAAKEVHKHERHLHKGAKETELGEEHHMSDDEMKKREHIVKSMKKGLAGFKERYGNRAKNVMYATATKQAMKEEVEQADEATALERMRGVGGIRAAQNLPMGHAGKVTMKHVNASNASPQVKAAIKKAAPDIKSYADRAAALNAAGIRRKEVELDEDYLSEEKMKDCYDCGIKEAMKEMKTGKSCESKYKKGTAEYDESLRGYNSVMKKGMKEGVELDEANTESKKEFVARQARLAAAGAQTAKNPERLKRMMKIPGYAAAMGLAKKTTKEEVETVEEDIGAMQSVVGEDKGKKAIRVDTLKGVTTSTDPEVKIANAHFSGKSATLKAEGKGTDTAIPFVTDSATHKEINKSVKPTFKKIKEMLGKTGTSE